MRILARILGLSAMVVLSAGCDSMQKIIAGMDRPTASVQSVKIADLSLQGATLMFDVAVANPYEVPLPLSDIDFALASGQSRFLSGQAKVAGTIPAKGAKVLSVPAAVKFADLLKIARDVRAGSLVPYAADLNFSVDAPAVGKIAMPLHKEGQVPIPAVPEVHLDSVQWQNISLGNTTALLKLRVKNTNDFAFDLNKLGYQLSLSGSQIASSSVVKTVGFEKGGEGTLEIPISFSATNLGLSFLNVIRGKGAGYQISGLMSLTTPFGPLEMPYARGGQTTFTGGK